MAGGAQLEKSPVAVPGQILPAGRWTALWTLARMRWAGMAPAERRWAAVATLLLAAVAGTLAWYSLRTDWRTLYVNLDPDDARQMEQVLAQAQISFEPTRDGGGILVPSDQLDKARLTTAAKGGVKSGRLGFEIFDKPNWVGSEFDERVNYQRALEGELEHTIGTLSDVASARVHLVMPHESLFREQERPAKATVVLKLRHRTLADGEPEAIASLVAAAVDGLAAEHVVLVDADGHLPLGPKTPEAMRLSAERSLEDKLVNTLEPVTGLDNVRASVTLDYDPEASDETVEIYDPDKTVALSMQRTEQSSGGQPVPAGVAGAASNAPNTQALPVYPRQTTPPETQKTESGTYGASKTVRHVIDSPGGVRRLTAAIVVNDRQTQAATSGRAAVWQARTPEELRNLTALAQAAVGYNPARGDVLTVEDLSFDANRPAPPQAMPARVADAVEHSPVLVKYAALLLGLLLFVLLAVRPALRRAGAASVRATKPEARELGAGAATAPAAELARPASPINDLERQRSQEIFDQVASHLKREPTQSSRLLQSWIHSE